MSKIKVYSVTRAADSRLLYHRFYLALADGLREEGVDPGGERPVQEARLRVRRHAADVRLRGRRGRAALRVEVGGVL